jgi:hypothetical protein
MENYGRSMRARAWEFMMPEGWENRFLSFAARRVFLPDKLFANKRQTAPNLPNAISTRREASAVPAGLEKNRFFHRFRDG